MPGSNYNLPPRPIAQRTTYAWGYMNWLWHTRHRAELIWDEARLSGCKVVKQWPARPAHPAYRHRRDRIPEGHWCRFYHRLPQK